jgi:type VI secretion system protein ImpB
MPKEGTVAPRSRVNIKYKPATGDAKEEKELPLKLVMMGDYTLRKDDRPVEERKPISLDKDNFEEVMRQQQLSLSFNVADRLSGKPEDEMSVKLKFDGIKDFTPDAVVQQVPELKTLLDLRNALLALKGPLADRKEFVKKLKALLDGTDVDSEKFLREIGVTEEGAGTEGT